MELSQLQIRHRLDVGAPINPRCARKTRPNLLPTWSVFIASFLEFRKVLKPVASDKKKKKDEWNNQ